MSIFRLPIILVLFLLLIMYSLHESGIGWSYSITYRIEVTIVLFLIGLLILAISAYSFRKAKTTVNPIYPEKSSALVIAGIYRHSRNPMYIAFLLWVLAGIVYFENVINLVFIPIFIILSNKLYIEREEHALEKIFGESFTIYKTQVRRWL